jgi:hypothetical protein
MFPSITMRDSVPARVAAQELSGRVPWVAVSGAARFEETAGCTEQQILGIGHDHDVLAHPFVPCEANA